MVAKSIADHGEPNNHLIFISFFDFITFCMYKQYKEFIQVNISVLDVNL